MGSVRGLAFAASLGLLLSALGCSASDPTAGLALGGRADRLAPMKGTADAVTGSDAIAAAPDRLPVSVGAVQFLPVVGAPADKVELLSAALAREAQRAGLTIAPADQPATPVRLKGYLSALGEGRGTVVVYVWDVVDPAGNRLSRIQGQERASAGPAAGDPWAGVGADVIGAVAARTIDELARRGAAG